MEIREREVGRVKILDLEGKLTSGAGDAELKRRVAELIAAGDTRVVVNLAAVPYVDSSGLGELVRCFSAARRAGGTLKLASPGRRMVDLMTITKLDTVFDTYATADAAVASFD